MTLHERIQSVVWDKQGQAFYGHSKVNPYKTEEETLGESSCYLWELWYVTLDALELWLKQWHSFNWIYSLWRI